MDVDETDYTEPQHQNEAVNQIEAVNQNEARIQDDTLVYKIDRSYLNPIHIENEHNRQDSDCSNIFVSNDNVAPDSYDTNEEVHSIAMDDLPPPCSAPP